MTQAHFVVYHEETGVLTYSGKARPDGEAPPGHVLAEIEPPDSGHLSWDRGRRAFVETRNYAIYHEDTGELVSVASDIAYPLPAGLVAVQCEPPTSEVAWDMEHRTFVPVADAYWQGREGYCDQCPRHFKTTSGLLSHKALSHPSQEEHTFS